MYKTGVLIINIIQFCLLCLILEVNGRELKQVYVLSRHNVRAPLTINLERITPNKWPKFSSPVAYLTNKGVLLEEYLSGAFKKWLDDENFNVTCEDIYLYANVYQRTKETAKAFAKSFGGCKIHYKKDVTSDTTFIPLIHNISETNQNIAITDMERKLKLNLKEEYSLIDNIIDFNNSVICKTELFCDFVNKENEILFKEGTEPDVYGPMSIGNSVVDAFLMSYYEGLPINDIAWGKITEAKLKSLLKITVQNQNVRFNNTIVARNVVKPLLNYMRNLFLNESAPKLTVLFGHDSTLTALMASLEFRAYKLPEQFEMTPIGGKLVFQKWYDEVYDRDLLKINYFYQSTNQLRNGKPLTEENPPYNVVMKMDVCELEADYCLWNDFMKILDEARA